MLSTCVMIKIGRIFCALGYLGSLLAPAHLDTQLNLAERNIYKFDYIGN